MHMLAKMPRFGDILARHVVANHLTLPVFARKVGMDVTQVYRVVDGTRPPPGRYLARMMDVLRLSPRKRAVFMMLAAVAHVPDEMHEPMREAALNRRGWTAGLLVAVRSACLDGPVPAVNPPKKARHRRPYRRRKVPVPGSPGG